jgi:signal transduction histidine kinase/ActR/RegA family two-component response regulator
VSRVGRPRFGPIGCPLGAGRLVRSIGSWPSPKLAKIGAMLSRLRGGSAGSAPLRAAFPSLVLAVGLVATGTWVVYTRNTARAKDRIRFDSAVDDVRDGLVTTLDTHVALLRAGAGLFAASREVTPAEFHEFVERLELRARYPGIQGIGYAMRVPAARLDEAVARIRAASFPNFAITPAGWRSDYYPIVFLEPLDRRNQAAIGYDMFAEPVRHAAMDRAARLAAPAASGKVTLRQEIDLDKQAGFLIYVPIYSTGVPPVTEAARLRALRGFVYSPFRAGDLLQTILAGSASASLHVRVYDGDRQAAGALLFETPTTAEDTSQRLEKAARVDIAGRSWLLLFTSGPAFGSASDLRLVPWILVVGVGVSLLLFIATRAEVRARTAAEAAAVELRRSEEALRANEAELTRLVDAERAAHAEATSANRTKDEFLATLSHELRTPLNAILGWASMLKAGQLPESQHARALEVIARNAETQAELIEDLLDVSRIMTGKLRLDVRPTALAPAIQAAVDAVRPAADAKGIALDWQAATDGPVLGDPDRLQQVAWNLLTNAIKFTPQGGRVSASLRRAGTELEFRVADTGIGIATDFLPRVFERFRQRDSSTTRTHGGMGLGLAIVRHLVEAHGGSVAAESAGEGQGAVFTVLLPARSMAGRDDSDATGGNRQGVRRNLAGLRVLVVDDDRDSREMLGSLITHAGADATLAASAAEGLGALAVSRFDVLVADIAMPGTDGYTLIRRVRAHPSPAVRAIPAVAVTAYAREQDRDLAESAGFELHLAKPIQPDVLIAALGDLAARPAGR